MARPPRETAPGATYHVTARGNRRQQLYTDDYDRRLFLAILARTVETHHLRCLAFCLLRNHFHLLVQTPREGADLSTAMQLLNGRYAQWFNDRHGLGGHLFQGRFHSTLIKGDGHMLSALRYVFLNPVEAGLCSAPEEWSWSSYAATIGKSPRIPWVLSEIPLQLFAPDPAPATQLLAEFVVGKST